MAPETKPRFSVGRAVLIGASVIACLLGAALAVWIVVGSAVVAVTGTMPCRWGAVFVRAAVCLGVGALPGVVLLILWPRQR